MLVQSSVLIVLLLIIDFLLRKRVRAVFRYCLWMLVLVKLILPSSLSSPVSFGYLFGDGLTKVKVSAPVAVEDKQVKHTIEFPARPGLSRRLDADRRLAPAVVDVGPTETVTLAAEPATLPVRWEGVVFLTWLAIVMAMGLLLLQRAMFVAGLVG